MNEWKGLKRRDPLVEATGVLLCGEPTHNPKSALMGFVERSVRCCPFQIWFLKVQLLTVIVKTYSAQHLVLTVVLLKFFV